MKLGITGTRHGASIKQIHKLIEFLKKNKIKELHHGDCLGVDMQSHFLTCFLQPNCKIIVHPPIKNDWRAGCKGDIIKKELDYKVRDKNIVNSVDLLIGCPQTDYEILRSGTWATIRYAKKINRKCIIFYP